MHCLHIYTCDNENDRVDALVTVKTRQRDGTGRMATAVDTGVPKAKVRASGRRTTAMDDERRCPRTRARERERRARNPKKRVDFFRLRLID